jgi:hypothetical protein
MSLFIATPHYGPLAPAHKLPCILLEAGLAKTGMPHEWFLLQNESLITRARDLCAAAFLRTASRWLFFIDGDIDFQVEGAGRVIQLAINGADIAVRAYMKKEPNLRSVCYTMGERLTMRSISFPVCAPTHGYEATREAAMAALAKSWRRE